MVLSKTFKFLLVALFLGAFSKGYGQDTPPNIILIMADDLGYGELSSYGSKSIDTPNLDRLARNGVKFSDFHSNGPVCSPTRAALMTGKYQQRTGVEGVITAADHREVGLSLDEETMAEALKELGYNCGIFGKWHLGYDKEFSPIDQGFDEFVGFVGGNIDYISHVDQAGYLDWWQGKVIEDEEGYTTDLIADYGVEYIKNNHPDKTGKPFFLYLPQEAPHYPIQGRGDKAVRKVGSGKYIRKVPNDSVPVIYEEMIETMDETIGRILQTVSEEGLDENTLIVFCSDNGAAGGRGDNGVLRAAKASVYEGGHRVPAIISYPGKIKAGTESTATIMSMDLYPTFVELAGGSVAQGKFDGVSLKKHLLQGKNLPKRDLFLSFKGNAAIRSGKWKLVAKGVDKEDPELELYDLETDLSEQNDLSDKYPKRVKKMFRNLQDWDQEVREGVTFIAE
ncbi:sulfatase [Echinicola strongylocentroti]|uniref:Sulfatase n=1 Tax=Echinicola strongylocentroti TaxID=1795355 RepID=A0A2Z4IPV0_9BACT|nr:sulfatase-like hydrolase/transferase [Echinicola strongylocentroti]AWW32790.1 sulfatase [Echinicola strongylocentroti]